LEKMLIKASQRESGFNINLMELDEDFSTIGKGGGAKHKYFKNIIFNQKLPLLIKLKDAFAVLKQDSNGKKNILEKLYDRSKKTTDKNLSALEAMDFSHEKKWVSPHTNADIYNVLKSHDCKPLNIDQTKINRSVEILNQLNSGDIDNPDAETLLQNFNFVFFQTLKSAVFLPPAVLAHNTMKQVKLLSDLHSEEVADHGHTPSRSGALIDDLFYNLLGKFSTATSETDYLTMVLAQEIDNEYLFERDLNNHSLDVLSSSSSAAATSTTTTHTQTNVPTSTSTSDSTYTAPTTNTTTQTLVSTPTTEILTDEKKEKLITQNGDEKQNNEGKFFGGASFQPDNASEESDDYYDDVPDAGDYPGDLDYERPSRTSPTTTQTNNTGNTNKRATVVLDDLYGLIYNQDLAEHSEDDAQNNNSSQSPSLKKFSDIEQPPLNPKALSDSNENPTPTPENKDKDQKPTSENSTVLNNSGDNNTPPVNPNAHDNDEQDEAEHEDEEQQDEEQNKEHNKDEDKKDKSTIHPIIAILKKPITANYTPNNMSNNLSELCTKEYQGDIDLFLTELKITVSNPENIDVTTLIQPFREAYKKSVPLSIKNKNFDVIFNTVYESLLVNERLAQPDYQLLIKFVKNKEDKESLITILRRLITNPSQTNIIKNLFFIRFVALYGKHSRSVNGLSALHELEKMTRPDFTLPELLTNDNFDKIINHIHYRRVSGNPAKGRNIEAYTTKPSAQAEIDNLYYTDASTKTFDAINSDKINDDYFVYRKNYQVKAHPIIKILNKENTATYTINNQIIEIVNLVKNHQRYLTFLKYDINAVETIKLKEKMTSFAKKATLLPHHRSSLTPQFIETLNKINACSTYFLNQNHKIPDVLNNMNLTLSPNDSLFNQKTIFLLSAKSLIATRKINNPEAKQILGILELLLVNYVSANEQLMPGVVSLIAEYLKIDEKNEELISLSFVNELVYQYQHQYKARNPASDNPALLSSSNDDERTIKHKKTQEKTVAPRANERQRDNKIPCQSELNPIFADKIKNILIKPLSATHTPINKYQQIHELVKDLSKAELNQILPIVISNVNYTDVVEFHHQIIRNDDTIISQFKNKNLSSKKNKTNTGNDDTLTLDDDDNDQPQEESNIHFIHNYLKNSLLSTNVEKRRHQQLLVKYENSPLILKEKIKLILQESNYSLDIRTSVISILAKKDSGSEYNFTQMLESAIKELPKNIQLQLQQSIKKESDIAPKYNIDKTTSQKGVRESGEKNLVRPQKNASMIFNTLRFLLSELNPPSLLGSIQQVFLNFENPLDITLEILAICESLEATPESSLTTIKEALSTLESSKAEKLLKSFSDFKNFNQKINNILIKKYGLYIDAERSTHATVNLMAFNVIKDTLTQMNQPKHHTSTVMEQDEDQDSRDEKKNTNDDDLDFDNVDGNDLTEDLDYENDDNKNEQQSDIQILSNTDDIYDNVESASINTENDRPTLHLLSTSTITPDASDENFGIQKKFPATAVRFTDFNDYHVETLSQEKPFHENDNRQKLENNDSDNVIYKLNDDHLLDDSDETNTPNDFNDLGNKPPITKSTSDNAPAKNKQNIIILPFNISHAVVHLNTNYGIERPSVAIYSQSDQAYDILSGSNAMLAAPNTDTNNFIPALGGVFAVSNAVIPIRKTDLRDKYIKADFVFTPIPVYPQLGVPMPASDYNYFPTTEARLRHLTYLVLMQFNAAKLSGNVLVMGRISDGLLNPSDAELSAVIHVVRNLTEFSDVTVVCALGTEDKSCHDAFEHPDNKTTQLVQTEIDNMKQKDQFVTSDIEKISNELKDHYNRCKANYASIKNTFEKPISKNYSLINMLTQLTSLTNNIKGYYSPALKFFIDSLPLQEAWDLRFKLKALQKVSLNQNGLRYSTILIADLISTLEASPKMIEPLTEEAIYKNVLQHLQTHILDNAKNKGWGVSSTFFKVASKKLSKIREGIIPPLEVMPNDPQYKMLTVKDFPTHINQMMNAMTDVAQFNTSARSAYLDIIKTCIKANLVILPGGRSPKTSTFYNNDLLFNYLAIDPDNAIEKIKEYILDNLDNFDAKFVEDRLPDGIRKILDIAGDDSGKYSSANEKLMEMLKQAMESASSHNTLRSDFTQNFYEHGIFQLLKIDSVKYAISQKNITLKTPAAQQTLSQNNNNNALGDDSDDDSRLLNNNLPKKRN